MYINCVAFYIVVYLFFGLYLWVCISLWKKC